MHSSGWRTCICSTSENIFAAHNLLPCYSPRLVLTVNESREQTRAIHEAQRKRRTLDGLQARLEKDALIKLHRNAQKLLRPLAVINPFADQLTFLDDKTRTRRDHEKYLTLIDSIALLHQYQRPVKAIQHAGKNIDYVEVQPSDIETANRLAHEVLGRTLDELPAQTRKLLTQIKTMVGNDCKRLSVEQKDYRFSRRDIRAFTGWSDNQLKVHCARLTELEYLLVHRGGRGQHLVYELLFTGQDHDQPQMMGLIEPQSLHTKKPYDVEKLGDKKTKLAPSCTQDGAMLEPKKTTQPTNHQGLNGKRLDYAENALKSIKNNSASHPSVGLV